MMELKIYSPQEDGFAQRIQWNFAELKKEIAETVRDYETAVYTDDMIKQAKSDRAKLRKFVDAIEGKRKEIKKKYLEPYEQFEKEEKELTTMVQKAVDSIDAQVKAYEDRLRKEKTKQIREFYEDHIHDIGEYLPFERLMKPEYANASTTMKSIKEEILSMIQRVDEGLAILNEVDSPYAADMKAVFLREYDIGAALAEQNRLEAAERRRKEYEEERKRQRLEKEQKEKEEAQKLIQAGKRNPQPEETETPAIAEMPKREPDPVQILDFRVYVNRTQMMALKQFLKENGIRFEPVPKP